MHKREASDIIIGLDAPQKTRLKHYCSNLRSDRRVKIFDPIAYLWLLRKDKTGTVQAEKEYLDSLGYSASVYEYSQIKEQLARFQESGAVPKGWNRFYKRALRTVIAELQKANLKALKYTCDQDVCDAMPRKDTHAGFSFILTGKKQKGEYLEGLFDTMVEEMKKAKECGSFNKPILIGSRTQASGAYDHNGDRTYTFKQKTRLVSMIDIILVMAETIFAKPVQGYLSKVDWYAGGKNDSEINSIIRKYSNRKYHMFTIDYSSFDQTIPNWIIKDAFEVVRSMFRDNSFDNELFDVIVNDFIHKVFINGEGDLIVANKGVPSGSMFTQIIDSIVNRIMVLTYSYSKDVKIEHMIIMGDDNLLITPCKLDEEDLCSYLSYMFGVTANAAKCIYTPPGGDPEFLSRYWRADGVFRHPGVLIAKILYPERFRDYKSNLDMTPELIVYSYYLSFPRGVELFVCRETLASMRYDKQLNRDAKARHKWMSGLERFRAAYT